jgi:hypothetical protein
MGKLSAQKSLVKKPEGRRRRRWEGIIRNELREIGDGEIVTGFIRLRTGTSDWFL